MYRFVFTRVKIADLGPVIDSELFNCIRPLAERSNRVLPSYSKAPSNFLQRFVRWRHRWPHNSVILPSFHPRPTDRRLRRCQNRNQKRNPNPNPNQKRNPNPNPNQKRNPTNLVVGGGAETERRGPQRTARHRRMRRRPTPRRRFVSAAAQ